MPQQDSEGDKSAPSRRYRPGWCSFCRKHYRDVGPIVEGPDLVFICFKCIEVSTRIIEDECLRLGKALPFSPKAEREKSTDQRGGNEELLSRLETRPPAWWQSVSGYPEIEKSVAKSIDMPEKEIDRDQGGSLVVCYPGWCSFCRRNYRDVGALVEGADFVYICYQCTEWCRQLINDASRSTGKSLPWTAKLDEEKTTGDDRV